MTSYLALDAPDPPLLRGAADELPPDGTSLRTARTRILIYIISTTVDWRSAPARSVESSGKSQSAAAPCAASARLNPTTTLRASQSMSSDPKWLTWTCACITFRAPRAIFTTASP